MPTRIASVSARTMHLSARNRPGNGHLARTQPPEHAIRRNGKFQSLHRDASSSVDSGRRRARRDLLSSTPVSTAMPRPAQHGSPLPATRSSGSVTETTTRATPDATKGIGAGRRVLPVRAGFERDIGRRAARRRARFGQRLFPHAAGRRVR